MKNNNQQRPKKRNIKNPDPMSNGKTMAKEGMKILRNIAFGKVDINDPAIRNYFGNPDFLKALINECNKRFTDYAIHIQAINVAFAGNNDARIVNLLNRDMKGYQGYSLIINQLNNILSTGDTGFLVTLVNQLPAYRYNI